MTRKRSIGLLILLALLVGSSVRDARAQDAVQKPAVKGPESGAAAKSAAIDAASEEEDTLPLLEEMEIPSAEELLEGERRDWLVLPGEIVLKILPVFPRPDTLKSMQAKIQETYRDQPKEAAALQQVRAKRDRLRYLNVTLPDETEDPEYLVHMENIRKLIYHEDLMLQRADLMMADGDLDGAYELLFVLARRYPKWPGLAEREKRHLYLESQKLLARGDAESSLRVLQDLKVRDSDNRDLPDAFGRACDRLIGDAVKSEDFREARYFINQLRKHYPRHPVARRWQDVLVERAEELVRLARGAASAGRDRESVLYAEKATVAWPTVDGLSGIYQRSVGQYQRLIVGIAAEPKPVGSDGLETRAERRRRQLTTSRLFDIESMRPSPRYASRFLESWEPTDLGRRMSFQLVPVRSTWEPEPPVSAARIVDPLLKRLDPRSAVYDDRLASRVDSIRIDSPYAFTVLFSDVPFRPEPLLQVEIPGLAGWMTVELDEGPSSVVFQRVVGEPRSIRQRHVTEIVERTYPTNRHVIQALNRDEIDAVPFVHLDEVARLRADDQFTVRRYARPVSHMLRFHPQSSVAGSEELRRALAYAIDRESIFSESLMAGADQGLGRLSTGPFPRGSGFSPPNAGQRRYDPGLAVALRLAAERALPDGVPEIRLRVSPEREALIAAEQIVENWQRIGLKVRRVPPDEPWDVQYVTVRISEPAEILWDLLTVGHERSPRSLEWLPDWLRSELLQLDQVSDPKTAVGRLQKLHVDIADDARLIPLWELDEFCVVRKNVIGMPEVPFWFYQGVNRWVVRPAFSREQP